MNKLLTNHLVILQELDERLYWLEAKKEADQLSILNGGAISLDHSQKNESDSHKETETHSIDIKHALKTIKHQLKVSWMAKYSVILLAPSQRLTTRFIETPPTSEDTIRDLVAFEVSEALQIPIDDIAWDMLISSHHEEKEEKQLLWVATRKEFLNQVVHDWPSNALLPTQITPDFWAIYEYLLDKHPDVLATPSVLVSQEGQRATITIADQQAIRLTRSISLERVADEEAKHTLLANEVGRTLLYSGESAEGNNVQTLVIAGFDESIQDTLKQTADYYQLKVHHLTLDDVQTDFKLNEVTLDRHHLSMLCIAHCQLERTIEGINLFATDDKAAGWQTMIPETAMPSNKFMKTAGALFLALICVWGLKTIWFNHATNSILSDGKQLISMAETLKQEELGLQSMVRNRISYDKMLTYFSENLPQGILVKVINLDAKTGLQLTLKGGNSQSVMPFIEKLNQSPYFRSVALDRASMEKDGYVVYLSGKLKTGS